jgi:hypothetical protein
MLHAASHSHHRRHRCLLLLLLRSTPCLPLMLSLLP